MFLKERKTGELVEILDTIQLFNPFENGVVGRYHFGEEMPEPVSFAKPDLVFFQMRRCRAVGSIPNIDGMRSDLVARMDEWLTRFI